MDTSPLQPLIRRFLDSQTTDSLIVQQLQEHRRRSEAARALLTPERIPTLTRDELTALLQDTDGRRVSAASRWPWLRSRSSPKRGG